MESQVNFIGNLIPNAPADIYAAMGEEDQRIYALTNKYPYLLIS